MKGAIHGYFLGLEKSSVHGMSDFLEQLAKVFGLYLLASYICIRNQYDASFAVIGIVIGEVIAFLYSVTALFIHFACHPESSLCTGKNINTRAIHKRQILHLFLKDSVPLTTNRLALTVLQSIEAIMIPTVLLSFYGNSTLSLETNGISVYHVSFHYHQFAFHYASACCILCQQRSEKGLPYKALRKKSAFLPSDRYILYSDLLYFWTVDWNVLF